MELRPLLAVGGELKSTFCLTRDRYAILSQHIGDLENYETLVFFRETLAHMERFFRVTPEAVAYDLHPGYLSTKLALGMEGVAKIGVQHHHAHIAACAAENGLDGPVIGVAFDGTGYGTDGRIWGGEFLVVDGAHFERTHHFRYVPMAGGDMAIRQPWRMAVAYAMDAGVEYEGPKQAAVVRQMIGRSIHTVMTSSCGRLFDAVSALAGLRNEANFEGQAAMELESAAAGGGGEWLPYPFSIADRELDFRPMVREIVQGGESVGAISARFHATLATATVEVCRTIAASTGLKRVCLSGGSFQNWRLLDLGVRGLRSAGFDTYLQCRIPSNDGGLALGQAVVANQMLRGG